MESAPEDLRGAFLSADNLRQNPREAIGRKKLLNSCFMFAAWNYCAMVP